MGLDKLFNGAELGGLLDSKEPLEVSKVVQKAFIEVNEEGSEAAAATGKCFNNEVFCTLITFLCFSKTNTLHILLRIKRKHFTLLYCYSCTKALSLQLVLHIYNSNKLLG